MKEQLLSFYPDATISVVHNGIDPNSFSIASKEKCDLFISKYNRQGNHKCTKSCLSCTQLAKKYNFVNRIFTIDNNEIISAISDTPELSLAYKIKYGKL